MNVLISTFTNAANQFHVLKLSYLSNGRFVSECVYLALVMTEYVKMFGVNQIMKFAQNVYNEKLPFFCVEIFFGWHFRLLSHFVSHSHEIWIGMRCYITLVGFLWSPWSNIWSLPSNVVDFWWNIDEFTCKLQRWNFYRTIIVKYDLNENHLEVHFCLYLKKIGLDVTEMDAMHFNLQLKKTTTKSESCIL